MNYALPTGEMLLVPNTRKGNGLSLPVSNFAEISSLMARPLSLVVNDTYAVWLAASGVGLDELRNETFASGLTLMVLSGNTGMFITVNIILIIIYAGCGYRALELTTRTPTRTCTRSHTRAHRTSCSDNLFYSCPFPSYLSVGNKTLPFSYSIQSIFLGAPVKSHHSTRKHTHARAYTHAHTRTHSHTHTYTNPHTDMHINTHDTDTDTQTHIHTHTHTHTRTRTHWHTHWANSLIASTIW